MDGWMDGMRASVQVCMYGYVGMKVSMCANVYVCMYVYMCARLPICLYVCVYAIPRVKAHSVLSTFLAAQSS